jgi:hypothetical protein
MPYGFEVIKRHNLTRNVFTYANVSTRTGQKSATYTSVYLSMYVHTVCAVYSPKWRYTLGTCLIHTSRDERLINFQVRDDFARISAVQINKENLCTYVTTLREVRAQDEIYLATGSGRPNNKYLCRSTCGKLKNVYRHWIVLFECLLGCEIAILRTARIATVRCEIYRIWISIKYENNDLFQYFFRWKIKDFPSESLWTRICTYIAITVCPLSSYGPYGWHFFVVGMENLFHFRCHRIPS